MVAGRTQRGPENLYSLRRFEQPLEAFQFLINLADHAFQRLPFRLAHARLLTMDEDRLARLEHNVRDIGRGVLVVGFLLIALLILLLT
jgi:hypothetical protein